MKIKNIKKQANSFFLFFTLFVILVTSQNSYAASDYGVGRLRTCSLSDGRINDGLDFNPTFGGKDVEFVLSNPVCISVIAFAYTTTKLAIANMNAVCGVGSSTPRVIPSPILDSIDIARATVRAATTRDLNCARAVVQSTTQLSYTLAILGGIYLTAKQVYDRASICGANWVAPNNVEYMNNRDDYKATVESTIRTYISSNQSSNLAMTNQIYREWYYGGVEVEDNVGSGDDECPDVTQSPVDGNYPPQKYYLKGLETGNFNCRKYDVRPGQKDPRDGTTVIQVDTPRFYEYQNAYNCCKKRAREYVCIDYGGEKKFCKVGTRCSIEGIHFAARSMDNGRLACVESYSLCPYNFALGGGSEICDYYKDGVKDSNGVFRVITLDDIQNGRCAQKSEIRNADCTYNSKAGKCRNYCQYMTHCTKTDLSDYRYISSITSPYFSTACIDFVGDSQNQVSYGTGFIAGSARHFSAPIAQCVKETLENVFYNRAGHTQCYTQTDRNCDHNGNLAYRKGDTVSSISFFAKMQSHLQAFVKMVLTLGIVFYGTQLLFTGKDGVTKKELLPFIVKLGLILYFATGNAWQTMFFDGVYGASSVFSQMVFKIQTSENPNKRDGCQFGNITLETGEVISSGRNYPHGKEYLAIWDSLDCKIARYLGFGPEVSTANIAKLILAGFITGPIGIYFCIALLFFGLILIAVTLKALYIFLSSAISIILMVFISPLVIPLALFPKTNGIFKGWVSQLISFSLQPIILFAYIAIFIAIMDKTLIGSATFYGEGPMKLISCSQYCQDAYGNLVTNSPACDRIGEKIIRPKVDSIACMISNDSFGKWPGLEIIGISLPFLIDFFADHTREKILTITKAALIMYFLHEFMGQIPNITSYLIGGSALPSSKTSAKGMFGSVTGLLKGIQQRANRGMKKWGGKGARGGINAMKDIASGGNKGKATQSKEGVSGSDKGASSGSGDKAGSSAGGGDSGKKEIGGNDGTSSSSDGADKTKNVGGGSGDSEA